MGHNTLPDPAESQPLACVQSPSVGQTLQLAALLGSPSWYLIYIFPDTLFSGFSNDKTEPDEEKKKRRTWLRARGSIRRVVRRKQQRPPPPVFLS